MVHTEDSEWEDQEEDPSPQPAIIFDIVTFAIWVQLIVLVVWVNMPWLYLVPAVALILLGQAIYALCVSFRKMDSEAPIGLLSRYGRLRIVVSWVILLIGGTSFLIGCYLMFTNWNTFRDDKVRSNLKTFTMLGIAGGIFAIFQGGLMFAFQKGFEEGVHFIRIQLAAKGADLSASFNQNQTRLVPKDDNPVERADNSIEYHA